MQFSGPVQLTQGRVSCVAHQALAAFGGRAFAAGLLVRPIAELLCALRPPMVLLSTSSAHDRTTPRAAAVR